MEPLAILTTTTTTARTHVDVLAEGIPAAGRYMQVDVYSLAGQSLWSYCLKA